ncbi:MAG: hypothetical protein GF364_20245 [Candidatus Lokiarchaeota archaeon]|nr:hypothetical protein [Candidatus Lokiarchaeota archaeon]
MTSRKVLIKDILSILLMIIGIVLLIVGWFFFDNIDIDQGGVLAITGCFSLLIGIATITYKYKLRFNSEVERLSEPK